jgi:hypothetical protein
MSRAEIPNLRLPDWVPHDARETLEVFYSLFGSDNSARELKYMLQRLATGHQMEAVWQRLESFQEITPDRLISVTVLTWISIMREDRGLGYVPPLGPVANLNTAPSAHELAKQARTVADAVRAIDPIIRVDNELTATTVLELDRVAGFFERDARITDQIIHAAPLPRKARDPNSYQIAFVNQMCNILSRKKGRGRYALIAALANVVFDPKQAWDDDRVKHCYRSRSQKRQ